MRLNSTVVKITALHPNPKGSRNDFRPIRFELRGEGQKID